MTLNLTNLGLFTGQPQFENFPRFKEALPVSRMAAAARPFSAPLGAAVSLPATYAFADEQRSADAFLAQTDTVALLVLKDGAVRHELYRLTGGRDVQWISWSVAKSFVSALVGIAVAEGHIRSIADAISDYVDVEPGSAYDGVRIKDVLQMSSGARWNEDYNDPTSDVHRLGAAAAERKHAQALNAVEEHERALRVRNLSDSVNIVPVAGREADPTHADHAGPRIAL